MRQQLCQRYATALVTGASSGLGAAFTQMLLEEGVEVWGTSRAVDSLQKRDGFHAASLDLADPASCERFLAAHRELAGRLDLLINNAGAGHFGDLAQTPVDVVTRQLRVMLEGPARLVQWAAPGMLARGHGTVVNVASLAREFPLPYMSTYNAAKAGLSNLTRSLDLEWAGTGVTAVDFLPGDYRTGFNTAMQSQANGQPSRARVWAALEANLRAGPPPEQAARDLRRALLRRRSGVVVSGTFFQARLAPLLLRLVTWPVVRAGLRWYYRM